MGFSPNIQREIQKLAVKEKAGLTESDIYTSVQMKRYIRGLTGTLLGSAKLAVTPTIVADGEDGFTAKTSGNDMFVNYQHGLFTRYTTPVSRFEAFMGAIYHELSHIIFFDFDAEKKIVESLSSNTYDPVISRTDLDGQEEENYAHLKTALADPVYNRFFRVIYSNISNCIADRNNEDLMTERYGRLVASSIHRIRESLYQSVDPLETMDEMIKAGTVSAVEVIFNLILEQSRFGEIFMYDQELWQTNRILAAVKKCIPDIEDAVCEDNIYKRNVYINRIILAFWPFLEEELPDHAEPESGTGLEDALNDLADRLAQAGSSLSGAPVPEGVSSSSVAVSISGGAGDGDKSRERSLPEETGGESAGDIEDMLDSIAREIAADRAEDKVNSRILSDAANTIVDTVGVSACHEGITRKVITDFSDTGKQNEERCREITDRIKPYVKRLVRYMEESLRDIQLGGLQKHRQFGKKIIVSDSYRPDGRYFANKKLPKELPDMAISILVDCSGSMWGERMDTARTAAMLVYDYATTVNIPVSVAGHTTNYYEKDCFVYNLYADFETANPKKTKLNIAAMEAQDENRDGLALEIACNMLSRRPEQHRLLIIISDGQPSHTSASYTYGGKLAYEDMKDCVCRYKKQGIEVIAAAIGSDREMIRQIYGESFLNISDLDKLPKTLAKIISDRIYAQIS